MSEFLVHSPCSLYSKIKKSAEERKSFPFEAFEAGKKTKKYYFLVKM
jgi:hypothetical protein